MSNQPVSKQNSNTAKAKTGQLTKLGQLTKSVLTNIGEFLDQVGNALMGELWRPVVLTIQDMIGLSSLFVVSGLIFKRITSKEFSSFKECITWDAWNINRYFCFLIVLLNFCSLLTLTGRMIGRFWNNLEDFRSLLISRVKMIIHFLNKSLNKLRDLNKNN